MGAFIAAFTAIGSLRSVAKQLYSAVFDFCNSFDRLTGFFSFLFWHCRRKKKRSLQMALIYPKVSNFSMSVLHIPARLLPCWVIFVSY